MRLASELPVKKPYKPPKLTIYGDLTQMTLSKGSNTGMLEVGSKSRRT
jgi:hypothetical protein